MPTTFVLLIVAPGQSLPERAIRTYLQSEVSSKVKVCYVTKQSAPHLSSVQFLGNLEGLLAPIRAEDWLVLIYSGLYQKLEDSSKMHNLYRLAVPFRDVDWLKEQDLVLPISRHYQQHQFRMLVILDAFKEDTELALHHPAWRELPVVAVIGERRGNPEKDHEREPSLIGSFCGYLADIETNLLKREKAAPTIVQAYSCIKQQMNERHSSMESDFEQGSSEDSDGSSSSFDDGIDMRLYYSQLGEALLDSNLPL